MKWARQKQGFTIVELLIVVVVIAILAAVTIVSYTGITTQAKDAKRDADLTQLMKAIMIAKETTQQNFAQITGSTYTANACASKADGTDLGALPLTDSCWVNYNSALAAISSASGIIVTGMVDPDGWPYMIDENETATNCIRDSIGYFTKPYVANLPGQVRPAEYLLPYAFCG